MGTRIFGGRSWTVIYPIRGGSLKYLPRYAAPEANNIDITISWSVEEV